MRPTYAEIDLSAIRHNVAAIKSTLPETTKLLVAVKGEAYGHGAAMCAKAAVSAGADWLAVAIPEEGVALREAGIEVPILILGGLRPVCIDDVILYRLRATVYSTEILDGLEAGAARYNIKFPVHIKVDTGMHRIGVTSPAQLTELLDYIHEKCPHIVVEGLYSHYASADESVDGYTAEQTRRFECFAEAARKAGENPKLHIANSAAVLSGYSTNYDMVRIGIAAYGCMPARDWKNDLQLRPAMSLHTEITQLKTIAAGETVSYGRRFTANRDTVIATLSIGYGDGLHRVISEHPDAHVLIHGQKAPYAGRICMDQCMCDVTDIPNVKVGDHAIIFGGQDDSYLSAEEVALWAGTISYEVMISIGRRVPRVYRYA